MSVYDDYQRYQDEEAMERLIEEQLREIAEEPVFAYLSSTAMQSNKEYDVAAKKQLR